MYRLQTQIKGLGDMVIEYEANYSGEPEIISIQNLDGELYDCRDGLAENGEPELTDEQYEDIIEHVKDNLNDMRMQEEVYEKDNSGQHIIPKY